MVVDARTAAVGLLALGALACDVREPGPLEEDRGKIIYWEIVEARRTFTMCTDDPEWRAGYTAPDALVGSFVTYRISDDGSAATALACETTDPATCAPTDPPRVYDVTSHTLRFEGAPQGAPTVGIDCEQAVQTDWTLVDGGERLEITVSTTHELTGTATDCDVLDEVFRELGSEGNAFGLRDCVVTLNGTAEYRTTR